MKESKNQDRLQKIARIARYALIGLSALIVLGWFLPYLISTTIQLGETKKYTVYFLYELKLVISSPKEYYLLFITIPTLIAPFFLIRRTKNSDMIAVGLILLSCLQNIAPCANLLNIYLNMDKNSVETIQLSAGFYVIMIASIIQLFGALFYAALCLIRREKTEGKFFSTEPINILKIASLSLSLLVMLTFFIPWYKAYISGSLVVGEAELTTFYFYSTGYGLRFSIDTIVHPHVVASFIFAPVFLLSTFKNKNTLFAALNIIASFYLIASCFWQKQLVAESTNYEPKILAGFYLMVFFSALQIVATLAYTFFSHQQTKIEE